MLKIVLFGTGNVASHLLKAFQNSAKAEIIQVYNRSEAGLKNLKTKVSTTTDLKQVKEADIYMISIPDDIIPDFVSKIANRKALIVHTSGSTPLLNEAERNGVFYPLQTFSKDKPVDFKNVPLCLEADTPADYDLLKSIAESISTKVFAVSTSQRKSLHLSAVFACNFTNHLYAVAEEICRQKDLPFEILKPLIKETADKIKNDSPKNVQTGPAIRKDQTTIAFHLNQLESKELKEIYTILTQSIQSQHD